MMNKRLARKTLSIDYLLQNIENKIISMKMDQKGVTALLVLIAVVGVISFLALTSLAPFRDNLLTAIYPKNDSHALSNPVVTQQVQMVEQANLPQPQNVKVWPNDRMATISWDAPDNTTGIVGYIVFYGKTSDGPAGMTNSKQTIHKAVQIQPVENGVEYTVQVRSVKGREKTGPNSHTAEFGELNYYAVADGPVSPPVSAKVTPSDARVNAMRSRLTGFFDDFNLPAGPFDEKKWNHGTNGCVGVGEDGQFINAQFHAHNMTFAGGLNGVCGLNGNVSRPRAVFDTAGATEANPAQIEMDADGISGLRDVWYIDLIPTSVRKNGIPIDITSHDALDDNDHQDPGNMIRISQIRDIIAIHYYDINRNPSELVVNQGAAVCPLHWSGSDTGVEFSNCNMNQKTGNFSPLAQPNFNSAIIPNVRRHWVVQYSPQKIKVFIDGTLIASANTPAGLQSNNKFWVHSTIFGYTTGKNYDKVMPTTIMFHWDNFGFTGPAPTTVTHNYLDGGPDGKFPLMGVGIPGHTITQGNRSTKIPVPDQIGSPVQARLIFTMHPQGYSTYNWNSAQHVMVNGKKYDFANPQLNLPTPTEDIASTTRAHSTGIILNPADLKTGMNDITFGIDTDIINAHIELDYNKSNEPAYTQPKQVFNTIDFTPVIQPTMRPNDDYWFIEQYMGLATVVPHNSTAPSATPTAASSSFPSATPVPSQSSPATSPSLAPSAKPGDVDGNNRVDIFDYNQLLTEFGRTGVNILSDLDKNGKVDIFDFNIVLTNFGK